MTVLGGQKTTRFAQEKTEGVSQGEDNSEIEDLAKKVPTDDKKAKLKFIKTMVEELVEKDENRFYYQFKRLYLYCDERRDILCPYQDETRDIRSNIHPRLKEFPRAKPEGTPETEGVYLTVHPELSFNTDSISF